MRMILSLALLIAGVAQVQGPGKVLIHELSDGTLVEGTLVRTGSGMRLRTPFGEHAIAEKDYKGPISRTPEDLKQQLARMRATVKRKDAPQHQAVATWCSKNGYLTGLRRQLNHLLSLEVDDPWAREQVRTLAGTYTVDRTESSDRNRDRRKFVDFLFEKLAARDNVGAVMAVEKSRGLDRELTFRPAMKALKRGKPRVRWAGAHVLGLHVREPLRISALYKQSLKDGIWAVRREAIRGLKATGDDAFIKLWSKQLRSPEAMLRVRSAQALAEFGSEAGVDPLISALADTWRPTRNFVAITNQVAYVKDYDVEVAQTAFIADPVVDVLQEGAVLETAVIHVQVERRLYRDALRRLTGADFGTQPGAWRRWLEGRVDRPR